MVAVGMPVTWHPPHRSRRALPTHRTPASGADAKALLGMWVANARRWYPFGYQPLHAIPRQPVLMAAAA